MFDPKTRLLIVDDMMTMRKLVMKICRDLGFNDLSEANNGAKAWEAVSAAKPPIGVIISDWNMPESTGIDLLKRVRADSRFSKTPFLLVTAEAEGHQVKEALEAGVDAYIVKPFTADTLKEKLTQVYQKHYGKKAA